MVSKMRVFEKSRQVNEYCCVTRRQERAQEKDVRACVSMFVRLCELSSCVLHIRDAESSAERPLLDGVRARQTMNITAGLEEWRRLL